MRTDAWNPLPVSIPSSAGGEIYYGFISLGWNLLSTRPVMVGGGGGVDWGDITRTPCPADLGENLQRSRESCSIQRQGIRLTQLIDLHLPIKLLLLPFWLASKKTNISADWVGMCWWSKQLSRNQYGCSQQSTFIRQLSCGELKRRSVWTDCSADQWPMADSSRACWGTAPDLSAASCLAGQASLTGPRQIYVVIKVHSH